MFVIADLLVVVVVVGFVFDIGVVLAVPVVVLH